MIITDSCWDAIKDVFLNKEKKVGRLETCAKKTLEGILYVLENGCKWRCLPKEYGPKSTVHGKFIKWIKQGKINQVFNKARRKYLLKNQKNNWFAIDTSSKKAPFAKFGGKNPTDRSKRGIKHVILVDRKGAPLQIDIAPANLHDSQLLSPIIRKFRKSKKYRIIAADSAFDIKALYNEAKNKNIILLASPNPRRRKNVHKFNVHYRWIVEQTFGILSSFRGLKTCWAKQSISALSFLQLASAVRLFKMVGIFG